MAKALAELAGEAGIEVIVAADPANAAGLRDCQVVIEAVPERLKVKSEVLRHLAGACDAVIVTTTSTLSVTDLALASGAPDRVVGLHVSLPAQEHKLAEVARTELASEEAVADVVAFAEALGRRVVVLADRPGFITARLLYGYLNRAVDMVESGYATKEHVDAAMRFGCGYPVGPIAMVDSIGLDVLYDALSSLFRTTGERAHAPAPLLKELAAAGRRGQKSGHGFYKYSAPGSSQMVAGSEDESDGEGTPRAVESVGVVGSGTMATGIIEVFAKAGYATTFVARSAEKVDRVTAAIKKSLDHQVAKGRLAESDRDAVIARVNGVTSIGELGDVDLVVEAVVEDLAVKLELFRALDQVCKPGAVLATTTSSLAVIEMAAVTERPADVVGLHFFNPAQIMKLVEIVSTVCTAPDAVATAQAVCARTRKHPVRCGDRAGFIVNALLFPYLNDAVRLTEAGFATKEQIDAAIKDATGFPLGPFDLLDVVGNDVSLAIQQVLHDEFHDPGLAPAKTLRDVVSAGHLGRKTGRGFFSYA
ncbi:MAG: 3-hydroxyacyl-CoA dehydrogenase NAD-binding domain-containing protein [Candidatus Nanopelagicales bacterium]|nr:3-hydroxyacyl-CoA dehydrogenase NAD-binding domain-containing protein [Candidatus Nanopelagicales bacterium]